MSYKVINKKSIEEYKELFKQELTDIFESEGIEKCVDRYLKTSNFVHAPENRIIANLCRRAIQGNKFIYPINRKENYPLFSEVKDEEIEGLVIVPWDFVIQRCKVAEEKRKLPDIVEIIMNYINE